MCSLRGSTIRELAERAVALDEVLRQVGGRSPSVGGGSRERAAQLGEVLAVGRRDVVVVDSVEVVVQLLEQRSAGAASSFGNSSSDRVALPHRIPLRSVFARAR